MTVVADAGPIHYLVLIGEIELLPRLYDEVAVPEMVRAELLGSGAPTAVRDWVTNPPSWLRVVSPVAKPDPALAGLGPGERDAILLAEELGADQIIIDDLKGRKIAMLRGHDVTGTLGVLVFAREQGLVDVASAVTRLRRTNFRGSSDLFSQVLRQP